MIYQENQKYLTTKGTPVIYLGRTKNGLHLKSEATGHDIYVPRNYKLEPFESNKINKGSKILMNPSNVNGKITEHKTPKLAHMIDKYLFEGKYTVKEIAEKIKSEPMANGRNLQANVHARLVGYRRKGIPIQKLEGGKIKITLNAA